MKARIVQLNRSRNNFEAITDNNIALSFSIISEDTLRLNEIIEVDLMSVTVNQQVKRATDGKIIKIRIGEHDLHDLDLPMAHGTSRRPSKERLREIREGI